MFLVATNAAPRAFLETRPACRGRERARTAATRADSMAAAGSVRQAGSSGRPTVRSLPNLQEVGGTVRACPPCSLQFQCSDSRRLAVCTLVTTTNTPWGSRRHEEVQGTGVGGRLGHRGGSLS